MSKKMPIATVGLGLMGSSIAACILAAGHEVTALVRNLNPEVVDSKQRIRTYLKQSQSEGLLKEKPAEAIKRLTVTDDASLLAGHDVVIETIPEDLTEKKSLFKRLESVLSPMAIIGSNTSAIPISHLQQDLRHPERILGIHWAEPAHITRFMEIICGNQTDIRYANTMVALAEKWNKEPSLLRKDIRGFIANRLMYAMLREAFHLVDNGYANIEDVDRSLRNDMGYWITFAGPFRFMDLTGIHSYLTVMKDLFKELDNTAKTPPMIEKLVASGAKGVSNAHGFYKYTPESARQWEDKFIEFSYDIRKLAEKYSMEAGTNKRRRAKK